MTRVEGLAARVQARLLANGGDGLVNVAQVAQLAREEAPILPEATLGQLVDEVVADVTGFGPIETLMADPAVTEIMVNGAGPVWVERSGHLERTTVTLTMAAIQRMIERVLAPLGRRVDRSAPFVDARLRDGSRVNVVVPPLAVDGPCVTIRRFATATLPLSAFCSISVARLLEAAVRNRANIVVSGGTASGKTTLLNSLVATIPAGERLITVEDAAELRLGQDHVVRMEARPANSEGVGEVTVRTLVRNALRMRPDRIIVGEVRGAEALDMLQAMNTGHDGSLSTCHANSPEDALRRLETMVLFDPAGLPLAAVRDQLASAVDLVVHVARQPDGRRAVAEVAEVAAGDENRTRPLAVEGHVVGLPQRRPRSGAGWFPPGEAA